MSQSKFAADGSVVLITGASRGIGRATASLLARDGYRVFGTSRSGTPEAGDRFEMLPLDVTSDDSVRACVSSVMSRCGRIDVLVNNAALALLGAIEEVSIEDARAVFEANFFGLARMTNAVLPSMRQRKQGRIINFGSLAAFLPVPYHAYLSASKAAVVTYSEALRLEVRPLGIHVSVVEPGFVATHPGDKFEPLLGKRCIADYAEEKRRALAVFREGQASGADPQLVAETVRDILRSPAPACHYPVGAEKWYARFAQVLPASLIESMIVHRLGLAH